MSDLPIISQEKFVNAIESIRKQMYDDKKSSQLMAEAFRVDEVLIIDNSILINAIVELLGIWFDKSDIQHFCFELNFGKISDEEEFESIEELYERLTRNL